MRKYKKKSNLVNNTGYTPGYSSENNPINYIPSENITMRNTPYPVYGQPLDQNGMAMDSPTYMEPGNEYKFGGASYVAEVPAYKDGGQKSDWISRKIGILMGEGRPQKQAIAIAYSMWNQKHEMGGTQLPMMQNGDYYQNNPAGMQTTFSGVPKIDGKFNFSQDQMPPTPTFEASKMEPWKYGIGANPNATNALGTVPTDFSKNFPLPAGVNAPMPKNIGYKAPTPAEMARGVQSATPNGSVSTDTTEGSERTQFINPYGDVGMEDALGFSGQQFAKGNTGMGIAGAALGALKGTKSFLQGMGAQKRQNQITKGYEEDQRSNMTGEKREVAIGRRGGYFQKGDTFREEVEPVMEVNPVFGSQNRSYDDSEQITEYSDPNEMTDEEAASFMDMYNKDQESKPSASARDTWEQKTGMPWAEAKRLGYTSGTAKDNIKLLSELNDPRFKKENLRKGPISRKAIAPEKEDNTIYQGGELKEVVVSRKSPKKKDTYVDPYKGWYQDKEGDLRNEKGIMVGLDGKPLNWAERNFGTVGSLPPLDEKGRRMKKPGPMPTVAESNAYNLAQYKNRLQKEEQSRKAGELKKQQIEKTWGKNSINQFGFFQEGGIQSQMEEGEEGAMSNPQEEQGEIPQQGGGDQMQEIAQQVSQMLQQGADPQQVLEQLVQAGIPQEQAQQIIQMVMEQMQGGQEATPQLGQGGQMMKRADGSYSKRGMWDNIRDNKGSGKKPTAEMLEQERKINDNKKELGGYMYADGGINNPGFKSLPKQVQDKIKASMYQEGGEAMDEQMEGENEGAEGETPSMEQIESQVEQALKQGADPQQVLQQLVEMGIPEEQAVQMIQELLQEIQGGETEQEAPEQGQPMMKNGGEYLAALKGRTIKNYTYNKNTGNYDVEFE